MNRDEILNMPAGRGMDEMVTQKIFMTDGFWHGVKDYSTDISAAWEVVEKMCDGDKNKFMIYRFGFGPKKPKIRWRVSWGQGWENLLSYCDAESAPLAICRAALLAVMEL